MTQEGYSGWFNVNYSITRIVTCRMYLVLFFKIYVCGHPSLNTDQNEQ